MRALGRSPIICGGTGLYIKFLLNELSAIPRNTTIYKIRGKRKVEELGTRISESYCQKMILFPLVGLNQVIQIVCYEHGKYSRQQLNLFPIGMNSQGKQDLSISFSKFV